MYDLIGDIHGYSEHLKNLLSKLGYFERGGVWSHPERQVIFLGDFVDRGKGQLETVQIARAMVENGHALAVMGNHEFNAVAYATPDRNQPGAYLRPHNQKNYEQHEAFLKAVKEGSAAHHDVIAWFKSLPLYLDLPGLRVVHACWHEPSQQVMDNYLDADNRMTEEAWYQATQKGHEAYDAVEILLKGLEIPLPDGIHFIDKGGHPRHHIRSRWWQAGATTYKDTAIVPPDAQSSIPTDSIPADLLPGYDGKKPLFLGHYWMQADKPVPLTEHIACLDYSVANEHVDANNKHSKLVAYRWQGEQTLTSDHFVWVS
ncbi:MAG: metallophosphoesterase [Pseudohongiella nitratireducens]|nr:metallophosphoesterase [Pseudohongiella nitratireducens]